MHRLLFCALLFLILFIAFPAWSVLKQNYGGNLKVAEDLLSKVNATDLVLTANEMPSLTPLSVQVDGPKAAIHLGNLDSDSKAEIEQGVLSLNDSSDPCHWILDYPQLGHEHTTSITVEKDHVVVQCSDPDILPTILNSGCVLPSDLAVVIPFRQTQFGLEANPKCISGRPFADSITPVSVDSSNPYLSFKLNDVDVFSIPEDRFQQISSDPEIRIHDGPQYYLYLETSNLTAEQALSLVSRLNLEEAAGGVLNHHLETLLSAGGEQNVSPPANISFVYPSEYPFRIVGERFLLQWKEAGISVTNKSTAGNSVVVELKVASIEQSDLDLFRYQLLRSKFSGNLTGSWYEAWDELESSGKLVPLLIYTSRIAARNDIVNLRVRPDGFPDFASCWILQKP